MSIKDQKLTRAQLATAILQIKGRPLSFNEYLPFIDVYNQYPDEMVLKCGRQIGKSVSLSGALVSNSVATEFFNSLYIAPLSQQTSRFSTGYLDTFMESPLLRKYYRDTSSRKNVFQKSFRNKSTIYLGYAETEADADRIRGVNADLLCVDEIQDVSLDALPVLYETLSASDYAYKRLTGTAKTENNTLEIKWRASNQCEWVMKCDCGRHVAAYDFETCMVILKGKNGPACPYCHGTLDVTRGKWVSFNPEVTRSVGLHIPQFIIGARTKPKKWRELQDKIEMYNPQKLANEVFGLAAGMGGKILTQREAMVCSNPEWTSMDNAWGHDHRGIIQVAVGVDWSVTSAAKSYTVITVLGMDLNGKCYVLYTERLNGVDILDQVRYVMRIAAQFNAQIIASDRGVGVLQCQIMQNEYGRDKVAPINYVAAKVPLRWDGQGQFFSADRTMCIDSVIMKMKQGRDKFETPSWDLMANYWKDALSVHEEETRAGRRIYCKNPDLPDDWLHSVVFANIGLMILRKEFKYIEPLEVGSSIPYGMELGQVSNQDAWGSDFDVDNDFGHLGRED